MNVKLETPKSEKTDKNDYRGLRHCRHRDIGLDIGQTISPPPMLFSRDGHNLWMSDIYRGCSAFLILGGPSFGAFMKSKSKIEVSEGKLLSHRECLSYPGVLTMSVNNTPKTFRTNMWSCVDDPSHFLKSIWLDPTIQKFVPLDHTEKLLFDNETWQMTNIKVGDCPNILYYRRNEKFQAEQYLTENTFNWGNHSELGGGRTVMLVALRMLFYLGIRRIYLLGCDFSMNKDTKYHFNQNLSPSSIKNNNETYAKLIQRFTLLKPIFEQYGLEVYNCNSASNLKVFPFITFDEAFSEVIQHMPKNMSKERSEGLYDRLAIIKKEQQQNEKRRKNLGK